MNSRQIINKNPKYKKLINIDKGIQKTIYILKILLIKIPTNN
jgi:hypothetical protein